MTTDDVDAASSLNPFAGVTEKQREVLDLLLEQRTTKEMAHSLGVSPSAIDQRIDALRRRAGDVTRAELTRLWRDHRSGTCDRIPYENSQLPPHPAALHLTPQDAERGIFRFDDVAGFAPSAPWNSHEPLVVPEALDGSDATPQRIWLAVKIAVGIVLVLLVGLAVSGEMASLV